MEQNVDLLHCRLQPSVAQCSTHVDCSDAFQMCMKIVTTSDICIALSHKCVFFK